MGVHGTWLFLEEKGIQGTRVCSTKSINFLLDNASVENVIHVDVVGAFYDVIRDNFLKYASKMNDETLMLSAANKVMKYASLVIDKPSCILYFDGNPTVERTYGYTKSTKRRLKNQDHLEATIAEYLKESSHHQYQKIVEDISKLFFITAEIKAILRQVAISQGWKVFTAIGEAEVEIGIRGGIVMSNDSDMLFYPKVKMLIRPYNPGEFQVYRKSVILKKLGLTSEAFTTLGIIPTNDYDEFQYPYAILRHDGQIYKQTFQEIFNSIKHIQSALLKNPYIHNTIPVYPTVKDYLECYISLMNSKHNIDQREKTISIYQNSYNIFVLQRQQILPRSFDYREDAIKRPSYFFKKIQAHRE
ncbi:hypothetical protein [Parasitella parasitica]|uniref:XPG-I domain-containing protein n=1 Tax=Parasitella parasitica TaxID=35722 RepID=A0A0B7NCL8_9FUNG|nr:hypothetical protein [Parasitella parasitica]